MTDIKRADALTKALESKFGHKSASLGSETVKLDVIPTGSLALDYALGTGGWPLRHPVEVFGPPDIGKSSVIGFNAVRSAQALGKLCVWIALEPGFDPEWAMKNGVDPESLIIARPNTGEDAFAILYTVVAGDTPADFVVFDSIGAIVSQVEQNEDDTKSRVGGQSKLITDGIKRCLMPVYKNNIGLILLNQIRDVIGARVSGVVESPGGHALKHSCAVRVQLKSTGKPITARVKGEEDPVVIGRELVGVIQRNKLSEGTKRKAQFTYYQMETESNRVGIDLVEDVLATGIRTGVIKKSGSFYTHSTFGQVHGKEPIRIHFDEHPESVGKIRDEVMRHMIEQLAKKKDTKPELEVIDGDA